MCAPLGERTKSSHSQRVHIYVSDAGRQRNCTADSPRCDGCGLLAFELGPTHIAPGCRNDGATREPYPVSSSTSPQQQGLVLPWATVRPELNMHKPHSQLLPDNRRAVSGIRSEPSTNKTTDAVPRDDGESNAAPQKKRGGRPLSTQIRRKRARSTNTRTSAGTVFLSRMHARRKRGCPRHYYY